MDLTDSFLYTFDGELLARYAFKETRNASAVLRGTNPTQFRDIVNVLRAFRLAADDLIHPGGNESRLAGRLNLAFRHVGWREARVDTTVRLQLRMAPYRDRGEVSPKVVESIVSNEGYKVDNVKGRVALDVEWNAKDGNLDRDLAAYRALYDFALVDVGVMLTRTQDDLRPLAVRLATAAGVPDPESRLKTTTTTHLGKLTPRLARGDGGGCPVLAIAISSLTFDSTA